MKNLSVRYVYEDVDRHGNVRVYFWRVGQRKVRLRAKQGTPAFWDEYNAAVRLSETGALDRRPSERRVRPGTLRWLAEQFLRSADVTMTDPQTQRLKRARLEAALREPTEPGGSLTFGEVELRFIGPRAVMILRDRKSRHPNAANSRMKVLRQMFKWAVLAEPDWVTVNPARDVPYLKTPGGGYHSWTPHEVQKFEQRWPVGSKPRLALALLLWTGTRRSDVVTLGPHSLFDYRAERWLRYVSVKTQQAVEIPVLPQLAHVLDASPAGRATFIETEYGVPFTAAGFGNRMREWCNAARLPHCSAHGLRKAGAAIAAENGATPHQLMVIFGWKTLAEAERYTRAAQSRRLAADGMRTMRQDE